MVYNFFDKTTGSGASVYEELAQKLHKPVIKKFKRRKVFASFEVNIWAGDVAEMGSLSSFNCCVLILLIIFF